MLNKILLQVRNAHLHVPLLITVIRQVLPKAVASSRSLSGPAYSLVSLESRGTSLGGSNGQQTLSKNTHLQSTSRKSALTLHFFLALKCVIAYGNVPLLVFLFEIVFLLSRL